MDAIVADIRAALERFSDAERAVGQQAYMKSAMPYRGVPTPLARKTTRQIAAEYGLSVRRSKNIDADTEVPRILAVAQELFDGAQYREERHAALYLTDLPAAYGRLEFIPFYEHVCEVGAWWDFVDELSARIGALLDVHPDVADPQVRTWARHECFWVRRLAIESQLLRKDRMDTDLLAYCIEANIEDKEWFIRKAIGWALRDYSYTDPDWVRAFVAEHPQLSPLSRREGTKRL